MAKDTPKTLSSMNQDLEKWIRARLPEELENEPLDYFGEEYLDGLTVMAKGERGGPDVVVYKAENEEDLRWWQLEVICSFIGKTDNSKVWRWYRDHAENGHWTYIERRHYDYNAIEDARLPDFERRLRNMRFGFPSDRWEERVQHYIRLMNYWYKKPHWDYDRKNLCFIENSDSREHDDHKEIIEEPRPGSIITVID